MSANRYWLLFAIAAAGFIPTIWFYYVGEEAVFPLAAIELFQRQADWLDKTRYGVHLPQNPLFMWMIIPFSELLGWAHMTEAIRLIALASTLGMGLVLAWLTRQLTGNGSLAAFTALIYLTLADLILYRGWLAYVDPLFSFCIFASIALLWVGALRKNTAMVAAALFVLSCAFLIKTFTCYAFYGVALLALAWDRQHRAFLLGWRVMLLHAVAFAFLLLWYRLFLGGGGSGQGSFMVGEVTDKFAGPNLAEYGIKLASYPFETLLRLAPAAPLALYFWYKNRTVELPAWWKTALVSALVGMLPYWLAPISAARYLMPLYPLFALAIAWPIWQAGERAIGTSCRWLTGVIALQWIVMLAIFPYYQHHFRGENYYRTAQDIVRVTAGAPLYVTDATAGGMSVVAYIDSMTHPRPALMAPPERWENGFVIAYDPDPAIGQLYKQYQLGGDHMSLLCRGAACLSPGLPPSDPARSAQPRQP